MRLTVELRSLIGRLIDKGYKKSFIAEMLDVTVKTVSKWEKRRKRLKDRKRKPKQNKITVDIEYSILALRNSFAWGTAKIQQGLFCLPDYILETIPDLVQGIHLSRQAINNVLKKHKLNGYKNKQKTWKFFRAKTSNELWQIDLKGPVILQGKKHHFIVLIDDYSRFLLLFKMLDHVPTTNELFKLITPLIEKHAPKNILADNGAQFRKQWEKELKFLNVTPLFAHPYYPQDKGKVERCIRTLTEEFIETLKKFPDWCNKIDEYSFWHNEKRFHRAINCAPAQLYLKT